MADGVIHAPFNHDFANLKQHSEHDRRVMETLGGVLAGSDRPLVISSGTGLARSKTGGPVVETDDHVTSAEFARAASEEGADALVAKGARVMVMWLSQVHDTRHQGRIAQHILHRPGDRCGVEDAGRIDHAGGSARLLRLVGGPRPDRSRGLQRADAPMLHLINDLEHFPRQLAREVL